jgi:hypothetical protein
MVMACDMVTPRDMDTHMAVIITVGVIMEDMAERIRRMGIIRRNRFKIKKVVSSSKLLEEHWNDKSSGEATYLW